MAEGEACHALIDIAKQAGAEVVGIGMAVEKGYQKGGHILREEGYKVEAMAVIEAMDYDSQTISFREEQEPTDRPTTITEQDKEFMREAFLSQGLGHFLLCDVNIIPGPGTKTAAP